MKPDWCDEKTWETADYLFRCSSADVIALALRKAHQRGRREGMEEAGADIAERLRLRSLAINEALVEQRDIDAAVLMSCDLPNIPAVAIRAKMEEQP